MNRVRHAMNQFEPAEVQTLLVEIADILSPGSAGKQVRPDFSLIGFVRANCRGATTCYPE